MANGVSRFSRLLPDHVNAEPDALTIVPNSGLASTFDQGSGVSRSPSSTMTYSRPSGVKPPMPFSMTQRRHRHRRCGGGAASVSSRRAGRARRPGTATATADRAASELAEVAVAARRARRREQLAVGLGHAVGAQQEHAARPVVPAGPPRLLHEAGQQLLGLVEVLRRMLVQDDDVGAQALDAPVLLRVQQLPDERDEVASVIRTSTIGRSPEMP